MKIKRVVGAFAIVAILVGCLPPPSPLANNRNTAIWAGFTAMKPASGLWKSVSASWAIARVNCGPGEYSTAYTWAGLDGGVVGAPASVEQVGSASVCVNGAPIYFPWWSIFDARLGNVITPIKPSEGLPYLQPGDQVDASVEHPAPGNARSDSYLLKLHIGRGSVSHQDFYWQGVRYWTAPAATAECILEAPSELLSNFGSMSIVNCNAVDSAGFLHYLPDRKVWDISDPNAPIGSADPTTVYADRIVKGSIVRAEPYNLSQGGKFQVAWKHA